MSHLFFISAFLSKVGQSLLGLFNVDKAPWWVVNVCVTALLKRSTGAIILNTPTLIQDEEQTVMPSDPIQRFYHDVSEAEAQKWVDSLLSHSIATKKAPATGAAYLTVPSAYVLRAQDNALPLACQEAMVASVRENGVKMENVVLETSHSPWLVQPQTVVDLLKRAVG